MGDGNLTNHRLSGALGVIVILLLGWLFVLLVDTVRENTDDIKKTTIQTSVNKEKIIQLQEISKGKWIDE